MKITAGIGSADAYIPCVEAGAQELFCGYVPADWMEKYGIFLPLFAVKSPNFNTPALSKN